MLWEKVVDRKSVTSRSLLNIAEHMEDGCPTAATARIRYQLELGADANIKDDDGYFPLLYTAQGKCVDAAKLLLDAGAGVNARCACSGWLAGGWTALLVASDHDESQQIVELLLDHNADMQARTNDGDNALALAVEKNNSGVVDLLVKKHIDLNAGDTGGVTALIFAADRLGDDATTVRYLLERGAAVDLKDKDGRTALMFAAQQGNAEAVQLLIGRGAQAAGRKNRG